MMVKRNSDKTFGEIAAETGLTNVYVAQRLRRQVQLKPDTARKLRAALPGLTDTHVYQMNEPPLRSYDPSIVQDPTVYRLYEAVMHFGESIKEVINEEFGGGIMSAFGFFFDGCVLIILQVALILHRLGYPSGRIMFSCFFNEISDLLL